MEDNKKSKKVLNEKMKNNKLAVFVIAGFLLLAVVSVAAFGFGNFNSNEDAQTFHKQMKTAIENNDFQAWKTLMESQITEENFAEMQQRPTKMSEMHQIREQLKEALENGDSETVEDLKTQLEEIMPKQPHGMGNSYKMGFKHGFNFAENNLN